MKLDNLMSICWDLTTAGASKPEGAIGFEEYFTVGIDENWGLMFKVAFGKYPMIIFFVTSEEEAFDIDAYLEKSKQKIVNHYERL